MKYFVDTYTVGELQRNLNAISSQGYKILNIYPAGENVFVVIAELIANKPKDGE